MSMCTACMFLQYQLFCYASLISFCSTSEPSCWLLQVTHDISNLSCADVFRAPGVQTPVIVRFSTVIHERGSPETLRDPRGFAVKFYTREGNWDLVGNNSRSCRCFIKAMHEFLQSRKGSWLNSHKGLCLPMTRLWPTVCAGQINTLQKLDVALTFLSMNFDYSYSPMLGTYCSVLVCSLSEGIYWLQYLELQFGGASALHCASLLERFNYGSSRLIYSACRTHKQWVVAHLSAWQGSCIL